jgi:hypothetical protein
MPEYDEKPAFLALKEWSVVVDALLRGELAFLMRKGGIHEPANWFLTDARRFWLYPTFEHQFERDDRSLLREPWATRLRQSRRVYRNTESPDDERIGSLRHTPELIEIRGYAETVDVFELWTERSVTALTDFGVWTSEFVNERLRWKPRQPLVAFVLECYRLASPMTVRSDDAPKRCRSWLEIPLALGDEVGELVSCPSTDRIRGLCAELVASDEEVVARKARRVVPETRVPLTS